MKKTYIIPNVAIHNVALKRNMMLSTSTGTLANQTYGMDAKGDDFYDAWDED